MGGTNSNINTPSPPVTSGTFVATPSPNGLKVKHIDGREICQYDQCCTDKRNDHFKTYAHPFRDIFYPIPPDYCADGSLPFCECDEWCTDRSIDHLKKFRHPRKEARNANSQVQLCAYDEFCTNHESSHRKNYQHPRFEARKKEWEIHCGQSSIPSDGTTVVVKNLLPDYPSHISIGPGGYINGYSFYNPSCNSKDGCSHPKETGNGACTNGHFFCAACLVDVAKTIVRAKGTRVPCTKNDCDGFYPKEILEKYLPSNVLEQLESNISPLTAASESSSHSPTFSTLAPKSSSSSASPSSLLPVVVTKGKDEWKKEGNEPAKGNDEKESVKGKRTPKKETDEAAKEKDEKESTSSSTFSSLPVQTSSSSTPSSNPAAASSSVTLPASSSSSFTTTSLSISSNDSQKKPVSSYSYYWPSCSKEGVPPLYASSSAITSASAQRPDSTKKVLTPFPASSSSSKQSPSTRAQKKTPQLSAPSSQTISTASTRTRTEATAAATSLPASFPSHSPSAVTGYSSSAVMPTSSSSVSVPASSTLAPESSSSSPPSSSSSSVATTSSSSSSFSSSPAPTSCSAAAPPSSSFPSSSAAASVSLYGDVSQKKPALPCPYYSLSRVSPIKGDVPPYYASSSQPTQLTPSPSQPSQLYVRKLPVDKRPHCWYGARCYRGANPHHMAEYQHPANVGSGHISTHDTSPARVLYTTTVHTSSARSKSSARPRLPFPSDSAHPEGNADEEDTGIFQTDSY